MHGWRAAGASLALARQDFVGRRPRSPAVSDESYTAGSRYRTDRRRASWESAIVLSIDDADRPKLPSSMRAPRGMGALLDFARHSLVAWTIRRNPRADDRSDAGDSSGECDR